MYRDDAGKNVGETLQPTLNVQMALDGDDFCINIPWILNPLYADV